MAYVNTGYERCKTLNIEKSVDGVTLSGYPKQYSILAAFSINGFSFGVLTEQEFQELSSGDYGIRLNQFKQYVSSAEDGVDIDANTEVGYEARRENLTACPITEN